LIDYQVMEDADSLYSWRDDSDFSSAPALDPEIELLSALNRLLSLI